MTSCGVQTNLGSTWFRGNAEVSDECISTGNQLSIRYEPRLAGEMGRSVMMLRSVSCVASPSISHPHNSQFHHTCTLRTDPVNCAAKAR